MSWNTSSLNLKRAALHAVLAMTVNPVIQLTRAQQPPAPKEATKKTEGTKQPTPEVYTKVEDPSALGLHIEVEATLMRGTPNDDGPVQGKVTSLTVGGKPLALVSSEIANDERGSWVATKAYGRIRVSGAYSGGIMLWLTPSQRTSLKALYPAPETATAQASAPGAKSSTAKSTTATNGLSGKTYATSDGDTIAFRAQGKATETNGVRGSMYPYQDAVFGAGGFASSDCTYIQNGAKINLTCAAAKEMTVVYTVNKDGSLTGPPEGMYGHAAFAHVVEKKKN
jgi:hypothetical protein